MRLRLRLSVATCALVLPGVAAAAPLQLGLAAASGLPEPGVALASADFDGDAQSDIAVLGTDGSVFVSSGASPAPTFNLLDDTLLFDIEYEAPFAGMKAADLDADGAADLVVYGLLDPALPDACIANVLWGQGDGNFELGPRLVSVPTSLFDFVRGCTGLELGDYDADGRIDVALSGSYFPYQSNNGLIGYFQAFLTQADGSFRAAGDQELSGDLGPFVSYAMASDDFDGDGQLDLAFGAEIRWLSGPTTWRIESFRGDGAGRFTSRAITGFDCSYCELVGARASDYSGDGLPDLVLGVRTPDWPYPVEYPQLLSLNAGDGSFLPPTPLASVSGVVGIEVDDFTADGNSDVVLLGRDDGLTLLAGDGAGGFAQPRVFLTGAPVAAVEAVDLDADGNRDLAVLAFERPELRTVKNLSGTPAMTPFGLPALSSAPAGGPTTLADFDGDGKLDVLLSGYDRLDVMLSRGDGTFAAGASLLLPAIVKQAPVADLNGDGIADLVIPSADTGFETLLGLPGGAFPALPPSSVLPGDRREINGMALGDLDADGYLDLAAFEVARGSVDGSVDLYLQDAAGAFVQVASLPVAARPDDLQLADVDGDGVLDLFASVYGGAESASLLWLGDGGGAFGAARPVAMHDYRQRLVDIDADGLLDIVGTQNLALGIGAATFAPPQPWNSADTWAMDVAVADLNADGRLDLAALGSPGLNVALGVAPSPEATLPVAPAEHILDISNAMALGVANFAGSPYPDLLAVQYLEVGYNLVLITNAGAPQPACGSLPQAPALASSTSVAQ